MVLALSAVTALAPRSALAVKTDLVILKNGDHITGEIKGVSRGKLDYSTDDAGRLSIEWTKVARVTSPNPFNVEVSSGARYFGRLSSPERDGYVVIQDVRADTLAVEDVIDVTPLSASVTQRVMSYLDVGFTLAKANQATTFSLSGKTNYRGPEFGSQLSYDSYAQGQESVPTTTRNTLGQTVTWYVLERWSAVGLAQFEQNEKKLARATFVRLLTWRQDYKVDIKVTSDFFDTYEGMYAKVTAGQTGFDITFPASTDVPGLVEIGKILGA